MKTNVGGADRIVRIILGIVAIALGLYFKSWWGLIGIPLVATGLIGYCTLYSLISISTCPRKQPPGES